MNIVTLTEEQRLDLWYEACNWAQSGHSLAMCWDDLKPPLENN